jgi:hypothetical protein
MRAELAIVEEILARALLAEDPESELRSAIDDPATAPAVLDALRAIDADGLRIAGLLVAKLRFERIMNGSGSAAAWFESDPRAFTEAFRRYHRAVPPTNVFPSFEARRFEEWIDARGPCGASTS